MKSKKLNVTSLSIVLAITVVFIATGITEPLKTNRDGQYPGETHASGLVARITMPNGTTRTADVEGVGCAIAMCSRVFIRGKMDSHSTATIWLDRIVAIKGITEDSSVFVMKDGMERRLAFINDFRVLYIARLNGGAETL